MASRTVAAEGPSLDSLSTGRLNGLTQFYSTEEQLSAALAPVQYDRAVARTTRVARDRSPTERLMVQPGTGIRPLVDAIEQAEENIQIVVFRFDRGELEAALKRAVRRGVFVHALVAHTMTGQGGEAMLRQLETRLLANGVTVARTASDLVRYHDKLMIVDGRTLFVMGFNFTYLDMERSRSLGIVTTRAEWVREAQRLFLADVLRQPYSSESPTFVVSPGNSRQVLARLLESAERELLIYDDKLTDPDVIRILKDRVSAGVDVRVVGSIARGAGPMRVAAPHIRLHSQAVVCDGGSAFLGSQSLRSVELDERREVGLILHDPDVVARIAATFENDWAMAQTAAKGRASRAAAAATAPSVDAPRTTSEVVADPEAIASAVKEAIKDAIMVALPAATSGPAAALKDAVKDGARAALKELAEGCRQAP